MSHGRGGRQGEGVDRVRPGLEAANADGLHDLRPQGRPAGEQRGRVHLRQRRRVERGGRGVADEPHHVQSPGGLVRGDLDHPAVPAVLPRHRRASRPPGEDRLRGARPADRQRQRAAGAQPQGVPHGRGAARGARDGGRDFQHVPAVDRIVQSHAAAAAVVAAVGHQAGPPAGRGAACRRAGRTSRRGPTPSRPGRPAVRRRVPRSRGPAAACAGWRRGRDRPAHAARLVIVCRSYATDTPPRSTVSALSTSAPNWEATAGPSSRSGGGWNSPSPAPGGQPGEVVVGQRDERRVAVLHELGGGRTRRPRTAPAGSATGRPASARCRA